MTYFRCFAVASYNNQESIASICAGTANGSASEVHLAVHVAEGSFSWLKHGLCITHFL